MTLTERLNKIVEIWKPVPDYPRYFVSNRGRIKSIAKNKVYIMNPHQSKHRRGGYKEIRLYDGKNKLGKKFHLHCLVLMSFVGPRPHKHVGAHLDDVKSNNSLENLAWVTSAENSRQALKNGKYLIRDNHPMAKLTYAEVLKIRTDFRSDGKRDNNAGALATKYGVTKNHIHKLMKGDMWQSPALELEIKKGEMK